MVCDELGKYPTCPNRRQIVDGGSPCRLVVEAGKNRRNLHHKFEQQQHQRKSLAARTSLFPEQIAAGFQSASVLREHFKNSVGVRQSLGSDHLDPAIPPIAIDA
jgi:hypothetical protein